MVPEFGAAVTKLEKGKFTEEPVKTQFGYHVILLEDSKPVDAPPLDDVKPQLTQQLQQQNLRKQLEALKAGAKIEVVAASAPTPAPAPTTAPAPSGSPADSPTAPGRHEDKPAATMSSMWNRREARLAARRKALASRALVKWSLAPRARARDRAMDPARMRHQECGHLAIAATARELQRRRAAAIGEVHVRARVDERFERRRVARTAVAQHDRFDQRRPAQVVDVIERRAGADQLAHDFHVAEVRGGNERGAVVAARDVLRASAQLPARPCSVGRSFATAAMVTMS